MSKSQAYLQRGQFGQDNMQRQTLIAECTGKKMEAKASRIKEISITDKRGAEVGERVKKWVWQKV